MSLKWEGPPLPGPLLPREEREKVPARRRAPTTATSLSSIGWRRGPGRGGIQKFSLLLLHPFPADFQKLFTPHEGLDGGAEMIIVIAQLPLHLRQQRFVR